VTQQYVEAEPEVPTAYRVVKAIAWLLVALGLLEWFVLGANRPEDPVVSPTPGVVLPVTGTGFAG
jgi:hypothetical protein